MNKRPGIFQKTFQQKAFQSSTDETAAKTAFDEISAIASGLNDSRHMTFDETISKNAAASLPQRLGELKKLQDPGRFGKARFSKPVYTSVTND